ncbi:MAG TPA: site-2 protease family protein [Streptosporangiaceae bacterium]|nr:site-2 protease family protein [Streptosporangiaceae bacterium]
MSLLIGWVIFITALLISITLHEGGHLIAAKRFGMKATQFFAGFGPTLWSTQKGETEYGIKAVPLGGFVKIIGMTSLEDVDPEDEPRSLRSKPGWQRVIVLAAGSAMHFALAAVLLFGLFIGVGLANQNTTKIGTVDSCVPASVSAVSCSPAEPRSPARLAGLQTGDKIVAFAGTPVHSWNDLAAAIRGRPAGGEAIIAVQRHGKLVDVRAKLAAIKGRSGAFLGISPAVVYNKLNPVQAVRSTGSFFGTVVSGSAAVITELPKAIPKLFAHNRASTAGGKVTSIVGAGNDTGQVIGADIGWQQKVAFVVLIIASLNVFVGIFNLLPLLPLDGGHIAVVLYERARAYVARLRGRADPGLVDMRKLIPVSFGIFAVIVFIGLMLIMADLVNPVSIIQ